MKLRRNKKGFTIIELVIVIAVIGILTAVLVPVFINLTAKANEAADDSLVKNLNTALKMEEVLLDNPKNETLQDAIDDLENEGYILENLISKSGKDLLWNQPKNEFVLNKEGEYAGKDYWQIVKEVPAYDDQKYSYYAGKQFNTTVPNLKYGFDAGNNKIETLKYVGNGETGQTVSIRTNTANTTLVIDAASDTVNHYGFVGKVDAQRIDMNCYNEYGKAAYIKLTEGKVVAKSGGKIEVVFAANNDENAVAVIKEAQGTIEKGLTIIQLVSDTNEARTDGIPLEYSIDGETAASMSEEAKTAAIATREVEANTAAQTAIADLVDEELATTVVRATTNDSTEYYSFKEFALKVNAGEFDSETNITFTLMANVNLNNEEWTPIGTNEHPFKWVFDGNGYTVKNFKISSANSKGEDGLFGFVIGNLDKDPIDLNNRWNSTTYTFNTNNIENGYTAVIKNLTVEGANISSAHAENKTDEDVFGEFGVKTNRKSCAAVIGLLRCGYAENITVDKSTINGYKTVGAIVGSLDGGSISNCSTTNSVTVNGYANVGGLVGALENANTGSNSSRHKYSIIYDCENYATINKTTTDQAYGYIGGIIGSTQNDKCAIIDCDVYGAINSTNDGEASSDFTKGCVGGIVGQTCAGGYLINCTNNAEMTIVGPHGYVGGIAEYAGASELVNCVNNADITANAIQLAGIVAGALYSNSIHYVSCINNGELVNTNDSNAVYDISSVNGVAQLKDAEFADVEALQVALNAQSLENCGAIKLINVTVTNPNGALSIPNSVQSISSDKKVCTSISLNQNRTASVNVQLPGLDYTYDGSFTLWINSEGGTITVPENITLPSLSVSGANSVVINGTVTGSVSVSNVSTITNNGSIRYIRFSGSKSMTFINNGSVVGDDANAHHSVCTQSQINLTINNHGSINAGSGNYALLFYGNSTVTFNAYATSTIAKSGDRGILAINNGPSGHAKLVTFNVAEGAAGVSGSRYYGQSSFTSATYDCSLVINLNATLPE